MKDDFESVSEELDKFKTKAYIRKDGPPGKQYCVYTEQTGKNMGCYPTKKEAEDRLKQIHKFA